MRIPFFLFLLFIVSTAFAQLLVDPFQSPENMVQNNLVGNGITVSNITMTGNAFQSAVFDGTASNIGLDHGILLSTGDVNNAVGPNDESASSDLEDQNANDVDLDLINAPSTGTRDAASIAFDFVPTGDSVRIAMVFASEEYPDPSLVVNDVAGVFISGPGINGPYSNNAINIATFLPGSANQPLSVNTVNDQVNSSLYIANGTGSSAPYNTDPYYVQFDGFTTVLHFAWSVLQSGVTYHMKIAIADAYDGNSDSGIFLEAGSLTASTADQSIHGIAFSTEPLSVHPNPSTGSAMISGLSPSQISKLAIVDIRGSIVREFQVQAPEAFLDMKGVRPGIYLLRVTDARGGVRTQRVVVDQVP